MRNFSLRSPSRRLSPLAAGAAVAVIVFSAIGVAAVTGLMANASSQKRDSAVAVSDPAVERPRVTAQGCGSCGTVDAIRTVEVRGEGSGLNAFAGDEIKKRYAYRVTVRMDDGSFRTVSQSQPPSLGVGDKVRLSDGIVVAARN